jgi:hypothetical protein
MALEVSSPEDSVGSVLSDLSTRGAAIKGMGGGGGGGAGGLSSRQVATVVEIVVVVVGAGP